MKFGTSTKFLENACITFCVSPEQADIKQRSGLLISCLEQKLASYDLWQFEHFVLLALGYFFRA